MFVTDRGRSASHVHLEILGKRAELDGREKRDLERYRSGYGGELEYDRVFDEVGHEQMYVFRDIWLGIGDSKVQLDALIVADNLLIVNEIKNYSGNYSYENGIWKVRNQQISEDPVSQVSTAANKLLRLRYESGVQFEVQKEIVFVNPYMIFGPTDYRHADLFVMRNRLKQYFRSFHNNTFGRPAKVLAEEVARRIISPPHPAPSSDISRLKLGMNCYRCQSFDVSKKRFCSECRDCGYTEPFERLVVRSAIEFSVLFPEEKVTCRGIHEFLGKSLNYQTVQRRLSTYFVKKGGASQSHYIVTGYDLKKILVEANYDSAYEQDIEYMSEKRRNTFRKYLFMSDDSNSV